MQDGISDYLFLQAVQLIFLNVSPPRPYQFKQKIWRLIETDSKIAIMTKALAPTLGSIFERAKMFFGQGRPSKGRLFLHLQINRKLLTRLADCKSLGRIVCTYYCFDKMHVKFCSVSRNKAVFRVCNIKSTCGYHNLTKKRMHQDIHCFCLEFFRFAKKNSW